jgi:hypothetical protein
MLWCDIALCGAVRCAQFLHKHFRREVLLAILHLSASPAIDQLKTVRHTEPAHCACRLPFQGRGTSVCACPCDNSPPPQLPRNRLCELQAATCTVLATAFVEAKFQRVLLPKLSREPQAVPSTASLELGPLRDYVSSYFSALMRSVKLGTVGGG